LALFSAAEEQSHRFNRQTGLTMRASAVVASAVGAFAAAPLAASANTIIVEFSIPIDAGSLNRHFQSHSFSGFDPSLGTLTDATLSLTGPMAWTSDAHDGDDPLTLLAHLSSPFGASQMFLGRRGGVVNRMDFDMEGTASPSGLGPGSQMEILTLSDGTTLGRVFRTVLEGTVAYDFTPPPPSSTAPLAAPEPSTWAMMLVGFAGLGYAAVRRKGAVRLASA
jgi:hypothetical protein